MFYGVGTYQGGRTNPVGTPVNQAMQMGLIASESGYLYDSSTSALYLGFLNESHDDVAKTHSFGINFYDEGAITDSSIGSKDFTATNFYHIRTTYTNAGSGLFDIDLDIDEYSPYNNSANLATATLLDSNFINASLTNVAHNFSSGELAALHPALGVYQDEPNVSALSGANFDNIVPEPSSTVLMLAGLALGIRCRR